MAGRIKSVYITECEGKVSIQDKPDSIKDYWKPIIVGELNNQHVKLVKFKDKFTMHHHDNEDEFFLVIMGKASPTPPFFIRLRTHFKDQCSSVRDFFVSEPCSVHWTAV